MERRVQQILGYTEEEFTRAACGRAVGSTECQGHELRQKGDMVWPGRHRMTGRGGVLSRGCGLSTPSRSQGPTLMSEDTQRLSGDAQKPRASVFTHESQASSGGSEKPTRVGRNQLGRWWLGAREGWGGPPSEAPKADSRAGSGDPWAVDPRGQTYQKLTELLVVKQLVFILFRQLLAKRDGLFPHLRREEAT